MKQIFISIILASLPMLASADKVEIDGIYYNLDANNKTAEVTYGDWDPENENGKYRGYIILYEKVEYEGTYYEVTSINRRAFYKCNYLISFNTGFAKVTSIPDFAFYGCTNLTGVGFGTEVTSIGKYAFMGCTSLETVSIPGRVKSVGEGAFYGCSNLSYITFGEGVTSIGKSAFTRCDLLYSLDIPNSVTSIGEEAFYSCTALRSLTIGDGLTAIEKSTFQWCSDLRSVTIGNGVTTIAERAFYECLYLSSATLGESVKEIGDEAFSNCNLYNVYCYAEKAPNTGDKVFYGSWTKATLYVHRESISDYMATGSWSNFKEIVSIEGPEKCATPVIRFANGTIEFSCATEGVEYVTEITIPDVNEYLGNEIELSGTYIVKVYATKEGYDNSDVATKEINLFNAPSSVFGDLNNDNKVDANDMVTLVNLIMGK